MPNQYRVQTNPLNADIQIQPAPMQSDTFALPAAPVSHENTARLAQALGAFSGSIGNLLPVLAAKDAHAARQSEWAVQGKLQGFSKEEMAKQVEQGWRPNYANDFENRAAMAVYGDAYGSVLVERAQQHLKTEFDWDNDNVDKYIAGLTQDAIDQYGSDVSFGKPMLRRLDTLRDWAYNYQHERKTEQHVEQQNNAAYLVLDTSIDDMIKAGAEPEDIGARAWGLVDKVQAAGTLGVTPETLEKELIGKARRIAKTNPEAAIAIIEHTRKDRSGKDRSLAVLPQYAEAVAGIQATAGRAVRLKAIDEWKGRIAHGNLERLKDGSLDMVQDVVYTDIDGNERTITAQQQKEKAIREYLDASAVIAKDDHEDGEERVVRELRDLRKAGLVHPKVKAGLAGLANLMSPEVTADPEALGKLKAKLQLHQAVWNENKNTYLQLTTDTTDREAFIAYDQAKRYLTNGDGRPYTDEEAINFAFRVAHADMQGGLPTLRRQEIEAKVNKLITSRGWLGWTAGEDEPANYSDGYQRVEGLATRLVKAGLEPTVAVEMAGEAIKESSVSYRGNLLDMRGMPIPDDFASTMDEYIDRFAKDHPVIMERNGIEADDITIMPITGAGQQGDHFRLVHRDNIAVPVTDAQGNEQFFTLREIRQRSRMKEEGRKADARQQILLETSAKARKFEQAGDFDGKTYWVNPKTKEVVEPTRGADGTVSWKKTGRRLKNDAPIRGPGNAAAAVGRGLGAIADGVNKVQETIESLVPEIEVNGHTVHEGWKVNQ